MIIELQLPYPPSANRLWRRSGRTIHKSDEYAQWLHDAGWRAREQRIQLLAVTGPYMLSISAARPDRRKRDLDNLIKPISDLLSSIGIIDDDCCCEMLSARWVTTDMEGVHVRVQDMHEMGGSDVRAQTLPI